MVCCVAAEEFSWSDNTPKDAAIEVNASKRAGEAVNGLWRADIGNIGEHPVQDTDLSDGGDDRGRHLN